VGHVRKTQWDSDDDVVSLTDDYSLDVSKDDEKVRCNDYLS
jgi:hypothetical protein